VEDCTDKYKVRVADSLAAAGVRTPGVG
jgi:hypothetical protein